MRKVELRPLESNQPGYGQLVIIGWQGASEGLSLDIQRNQDENFLQDDGEWRSQSFKFHLPALQPSTDGHLAAVVDEKIVDPLLANPNATNMTRLYGPDGAEVGSARLRLAQGLMPSGASGNSPSLEAGASLDTPQPTPAAVAEPDPVTEPEPQPEQATTPTQTTEPPPQAAGGKGKGKRWLWILLAVLVLAAIVGAAAWFGLSMRDRDEAGREGDTVVEESLEEEALKEDAGEDALDENDSLEPEAATEPLDEDSLPDDLSEQGAPADPAPSETVAAAGPCSLQRMGEVGELEFIQACTGSGGGDLLNVIDDALANDHCGIARRLYAHQALNGDAAAALAYAREFDPALHSPSACFPEADAETAIFWYETAQGLDADSAEAGQRLQELQG